MKQLDYSIFCVSPTKVAHIIAVLDQYDFLAQCCELIVSAKQLTTTTHCPLTPLPCPWHWSIAVGTKRLKHLDSLNILFFCRFFFTILIFFPIAVFLNECPPQTKLFSNPCLFPDGRYESKKPDQT